MSRYGGYNFNNYHNYYHQNSRSRGKGYYSGYSSKRGSHQTTAPSAPLTNPDARDLFGIDLDLAPKPQFTHEELAIETARLQWIHEKLAEFGRLNFQNLFLRNLEDAGDKQEASSSTFESYETMENFVENRRNIFEVTRGEQPYESTVSNKGFGQRIGISRIAQYIRRNDLEGRPTSVQKLYEDLIQPEPTFPWDLVDAQFGAQGPSSTKTDNESDIENMLANERLKARFDDLYMYDEIKHRRLEGKYTFESVKLTLKLYFRKLASIFTLNKDGTISLACSAASIPSLFSTALHPTLPAQPAIPIYHDKSREFLFTNCTVIGTTRNYLKVLIESDPLFDGLFVYCLGRRVCFLDKHMNDMAAIHTKVCVRAHISLFAAQPLSALQLYLPSELKELKEAGRYEWHVKNAEAPVVKKDVMKEESEEGDRESEEANEVDEQQESEKRQIVGALRSHLKCYTGPSSARRKQLEKEEKDRIHRIAQQLRVPGRAAGDRQTRDDSQIYDIVKGSGLFESFQEFQAYYDGEL